LNQEWARGGTRLGFCREFVKTVFNVHSKQLPEGDAMTIDAVAQGGHIVPDRPLAFPDGTRLKIDVSGQTLPTEAAVRGAAKCRSPVTSMNCRTIWPARLA